MADMTVDNISSLASPTSVASVPGNRQGNVAAFSQVYGTIFDRIGQLPPAVPTPVTPRRVTAEELTAAGFDVAVLRANSPCPNSFDPRAFISSDGRMPLYIVPFNLLGGGTDFTQVIATPENLAQNEYENASMGFTSHNFDLPPFVPPQRHSLETILQGISATTILDAAPDATATRPLYILPYDTAPLSNLDDNHALFGFTVDEYNPTLITPHDVTYNDLINAGYTIDEMLASSLPYSETSPYQQVIPEYAVPLDASNVMGYSRAVNNAHDDDEETALALAAGAAARWQNPYQ